MNDDIQITFRKTTSGTSKASEASEPKQNDIKETSGLIAISDAHWQVITKLYLRTYRGPNAVEDLKDQLKNYQALRKIGHIARGRYVRYLPRGLVDVNLKRGGWVVKCNSTSVHLEDGYRRWSVPRRDNFIFVRDDEAGLEQRGGRRSHRKSVLRLIAEEMLWQNNNNEEQQQAPRLRANFI